MKASSLTIENFKELIDSNAYYVDKTQLIVDCIKERRVLYTRPRRFGKTLNMSMLYYFFSNQESDNVYLFDGLKVTEYPEIMKHQNQYPVIFISLKELDQPTFQSQINIFSEIICELIDKNFKNLFHSEKISDVRKETLKKYHSQTASVDQLKMSLRILSQLLHQHYNQKVILLIDEYDVPLQTAYQYGYYDEMVIFLRSVFSSSLKTNDALEKGIMTGCLRISKESIFTGLNNFNVYSILDKGNDENFGFTENEVKQMLEDYHIADSFDDVKKWYDGYLFGNKEIYNPWSTIKYVQQNIENNEKKPQSYWANTSGNQIVYNYILNATPQLRKEFDQLIQGKSIIKEIIPDLTYREMDDIDNIYSFLLLTGYLKVVKKIDDEYELIIPNQEIYEIYRTKFKKYFKDYKKTKIEPLCNALIEGKEKEINRLLNEILYRDISYYDNKESFYHGFLTGLFNGYTIESNKESGDGRFDLCIFLESDDTVVLIECKHSQTDKDLIDDSEVGAKQIIEKKYLEDKRIKKYTNAIGYGISFYKKQCYVTKASL